MTLELRGQQEAGQYVNGEKEVSEPNPLQSLAVLLVDDQPANLLALEVVLLPLQVPLVRAASGREALKRMAEQQFSCILLDVVMPGMDGFETALQVRETPLNRLTPIIFLTAADLEQDTVIKAYAQGAVDFVKKPFVPEIIRSKTKVFIDLHRQALKLVEMAAEAAAQEGRERLSLLFENVQNISIFNVSPHGKILDWNVGAERIFGWPANEAVGKHAGFLYTENEVQLGFPEKYLREAKLHGRLQTEEWRWRKDGSRFWADVAITALKDMNGAFRGYAYIIRDATFRRLAEEKVAAARDEALKASKAKSAFLANMSHELRTPLNAILGYSELVYEELEADGDEHTLEDISRIRLSANHLLALVNDILDLSKIEAGKLEMQIEEFVLAQAIGDVVETARPIITRNENALEIEHGDPTIKITSDRTRLCQIIYNLLSNAAKFTTRGVVKLKWTAHSTADDGWMELTVSDTGIGIDAGHLEMIFEKFHQVPHKIGKHLEGTGLGLAINKLLCDHLGGTISVASESGKGSSFTVKLPLHISDPLGSKTRPKAELAES